MKCFQLQESAGQLTLQLALCDSNNLLFRRSTQRHFGRDRPQAPNLDDPRSVETVGKEHVVPLPSAPLEVLVTAQPVRGRMNDSIVLSGKPGKPLSDITLTKALRDMGAAEITVHGFRSTFSDSAAEQTTTPGDVVEEAPAHTNRNKVEGARRACGPARNDPAG